MFGKMEVVLQEIGNQIKCMDMGNICGQMAEYIKVHGKMVNNLDLEYSLGKMAGSMKETLKMT